MASSLHPLRYVLPITQFAVTATAGKEVVPVPGGNAVAPTTEVVVLPQLRPDRDARCTVIIDEGLFETLSLTVSLNEEGIIESIGTQSSRDLSPVFSLVAKLIPLIVSAGLVGIAPIEGPTLQKQWALQFPKLAAAQDSLATRIEALLAQLTSEASVDDIVKLGAALQTLRSELALIDRFAREWIAGHANQLDPQSWTFLAKDMLLVPGASKLPTSYTVDKEAVPEAMRPLLELGLVVAIADPHRPYAEAEIEQETTDAVWIRRARPVEVGVYERPWTVVTETGEVVRAEDGSPWALKQSARMDVVDDYSTPDRISFQGRLFRDRNVELGFYPDHSVKTYGVTSKSTVGAMATSVGSVLDAATEAHKTISSRPSTAQRKLEEGKTRLDLLKTSSEWAQLSATQERAAELAALEQQVRLEELRKKV